VAEVRVTKQNNKWDVRIGRIGFFNPADTVNDVLNDIPLVRATINKTIASPQDSVAVVAEQQSFEDELTTERRKKEAEEESIKRERIKSLLNKGDKALEQNDFTSALKSYNDAKEIDPYDLSIRASISKARNLEQTNTFSSKQLFDKLIQKAKLEENSRLYENALKDYQTAFALKPDEQANYSAHIKELTVKFRTLSELEEKYKLGLFKDAIKDYDKAIKKDNQNSDYYLGRGKCYDKTSDFSKALKDYSQSYNLDNNNLGALKYRADLYERTNEPFKAITDYKTYLTIDKENMEIYEKISNLHILFKQREEAIQDLNQAIEINPKAAHIYLSKGILLFEKNEFKNAGETFSTSIKIDSNNALVYYYRGKCFLNLNNVSKAAADFNSARNKGLDENNLRNIQTFGVNYYQRASANFGSGKTDSAIACIDNAILIDPNSGPYRFDRGEYYYSLRNYKEAINSYDQAIKINENYKEAYYKRGLSYYNLGNYQTGIDNFKTLLKLNPQDILGQKAAGDCYFALHDYSNSAEAYENCIRLINNTKGFSPNIEAEIYNMKGKSYFAQGNNDKALSDFKNALKYNKDFPEAYYNRGHTYYKMNQQGDAIDDISKAVSSGVSHYEWNYILGKAYQEKKDYGSAANSYANSIRMDTLRQNPDAIYSLGYCNYQLQNYPAALNSYSIFLNLKLDISVPSFNNELGRIYLNLGKYDSAYSFFSKSYAKDSTDGTAAYGIATALLSQGKKDDALIWFEKSFRTKPLKNSEIKKDKLIAAIRDDKRFKELMKKYY
jgi:tetratricopeptide (TPR) repeat protein